ncbi:hypothetical protein EXIGLDRAFT_722238 [Exidia glandulosa HHB12029]|uniref:Uncharacterized protein n=1 Tax=Exidia glandulosa HHB12029 TaxID=1314781 RepID=A0A165FCX8_EXIGL|nr:hypothetical protein EXIGLDRAFT_722238 [Exidia glandulosa HHB12029]
MRLFNSDVTRRTSVLGAQIVAFAHLLGLCDPRRPNRPALYIAAGVVVDEELPDSLKEYFSEICRNVTLCL